MGIYKICHHKGQARDRCRHAWWACFRGLKSRGNIVQHLNAFARAFPQPLSEITTLDVEQFALRLSEQGRAVGACAESGERRDRTPTC